MREENERRLPLAASALERADRMLTDLIQHGPDPVAFRDRLPYVLDLLAGVTRAIHKGSRGVETRAFSEWWSSEPIPKRQELAALRNAELKALQQHTSAHWDVVINASAADYPGELVSDGDTVSRIVWFWADGPFEGDQVLPVLQRYFLAVSSAVRTAEDLLE